MKRSLKILLVHNQYQHAGGEDTVFFNEANLLRESGHKVVEYITNNEKIVSPLDKLRASLGATWSYQGYRAMLRVINDEQPDIVHVHNFFPYPSASIFWACQRCRVPAVWTLHNFRIMCANGLMYRDDRPCTDCVGGSPLPAIRHKCYRGSRAGSVVVAATIAVHRFLGTWRSKVTRFIALTEFARLQFIKAGIPSDRIVIKPNFSEASLPSDKPRVGALYVGRLSSEKGVETLVRAWADVPEILTIIGDGPLRQQLEAMAGDNVRFAGQMHVSKVKKAMAEARLLIVPSVWFENFPMTVVEGMGAGTPILASRIGALSTIIQDGITGLHFNPGDPHDLARVANAALSDSESLREIGKRARQHFEAQLSPMTNQKALTALYHEILTDLG